MHQFPFGGLDSYWLSFALCSHYIPPHTTANRTVSAVEGDYVNMWLRTCNNTLFIYTVKHLWATVWPSQLLFACTTLLACLYVFLLCGQKTFHPFTSNLNWSIKEASIMFLSLVTDLGSSRVQMLENTESTSRNRLDPIFSTTGFQLIRIKTSTYFQLNFHISCCIDCIEGLFIISQR